LTLWFFFFLCFFLGGHWDLFSRGGTGVCFSPVEGGTGVCLFLWGDQYTTFFFLQLIFFFLIPDLGGTMAPAGSPIDPSLNGTQGNTSFFFFFNKYVLKREKIAVRN
jgi:hypothetical protein